ncbi:FlaG family protein [Helicobacter sp. TUL]|uniref:FlaG family protein n=1 Tax=Helicobacter sp. TUL TaxID=1848928 RepID=UPI000BAB8A4D|nr:FlaG family protein [Helicobacter sp. TUL]PAV00999.1 flagellar biosynthesis protein FlaG [Helicobacter sp. TUL]
MNMAVNDLQVTKNQLVDMVKAMPNSQNAQKTGNVQELVKDSITKEQAKKDKEQLKDELVELSKKLNDEMKRIGTSINFAYNDDVPGLTVTVKEYGGDKIIREIPSKEAIELMKRMREVVGIIFNQQG